MCITPKKALSSGSKTRKTKRREEPVYTVVIGFVSYVYPQIEESLKL